uniref:histidine kinase n=1 Tax=candidate division WOR-3 bacterium TaxID=2052148 RepID=A0A7C4TI73_UNCW3
MDIINFMNKRALSLLRFVLILSTILVMTYSNKGLHFGEPGYFLAIIYLISNFILVRLPERLINMPAVSFAIFLFDIIIISAGVYLTGGVQTDFYLIYFLIIFIASTGQNTGAGIPIAIVASIIYIWLVHHTEPGISLWDSRFLIRIPFLFIVSFVSSYWSESMHKELKKKEELERFNRELKKEVERIAAKEIELRIYNEKLINSVASGIIAVNIDGVIMTVNPEAERVFGYKKDELIDYHIKSIPGIEPLYEKIESSMKNGKAIIREEVEVLNRNQEKIPLGCNITPLINPGGDISGCVVLFRDLSEIRRLEEQLRHSERLSYLGKMASWVAHEIRNPLTSIDGFAQLLFDIKDEKKRESYISEIRQGVKRINNIIDDILTFARIKRLEFTKIDLKNLIENTIGNMKVKYQLNCYTEPLIKGEEEAIRRLFLNLINNSVEAMDENGMIVINIDAKNGWILTEVIDNGKGIPEKDLKNIFTPFFTTKPRGTGLGLAIVKKIIDDHNGKIEIRSELGKGTTCLVYLPKYNNGR